MASVYCARRIYLHILVYPVFNPIAPYQYLRPIVYLFVADIANPNSFVCGCRAWICLDITRFYEELCLPSSWTRVPACQNNGNWAPLTAVGGWFRHNLQNSLS